MMYAFLYRQSMRLLDASDTLVRCAITRILSRAIIRRTLQEFYLNQSLLFEMIKLRNFTLSFPEDELYTVSMPLEWSQTVYNSGTTLSTIHVAAPETW